MKDSVKVKVYSKVNCMPCSFTKKWLEHHNVNYEYEEFDPKSGESYEQVRAQLMQFGFTSFPIVTLLDDDDNLVDSWHGFAPNKLNTLIK